MPESATMLAMVRGRVQGVSFRYFVIRKARALGLTGYARNLREDHTVEVFAEGNKKALKKLLKHLEQGPILARVDEVEVRWAPYRNRFNQFTVLY
ncbi:MAG: acylphosphatase [Dehalococcoidia bacterium]|nr:acylphosphatase [Dehalococcoidia bacterium]